MISQENLVVDKEYLTLQHFPLKKISDACSPIHDSFFSFWFQHFPFVFGFKEKQTIISECADLFCLSSLEFVELLDISINFFFKFGKLLDIISTPFCLLSIWDFYYPNVGVFDDTLWDCETVRFLSLSFFFFWLFFELGNFYGSIFKFIDAFFFFSGILKLLLRPFIEITV